MKRTVFGALGMPTTSWAAKRFLFAFEEIKRRGDMRENKSFLLLLLTLPFTHTHTISNLASRPISPAWI